MIEKIHNRLDTLSQDLAEESEGEKINMESLALFTTFVELIDEQIAMKLSITLTPDNNICANYEEEDVRYCMCFQSNSKIKMFKM